MRAYLPIFESPETLRSTGRQSRFPLTLRGIALFFEALDAWSSSHSANKRGNSRPLTSLKIQLGVVLLVMGSTGGLNPAFAQTVPANESTSASADKEVGARQRTKDGRRFEDLSEEDVSKLNLREKITYKKWSIEEEEKKTIAAEQRSAKYEEEIIAINQRIAMEWASLSKQPKNLLLIALVKDPQKALKFLTYIVENDIPPSAYAKELLLDLKLDSTATKR